MSKEAIQTNTLNDFNRKSVISTKPLVLGLQFFSDPTTTETKTATEDKGENSTNQTTEKTETEKTEPDKTFSQSDIDRIVAERLAKAEKTFKTKLEKEKGEAERLATMSAEERTKAEFEKEKADFMAEKQALESQKLELQTRKELSTNGLNENFAPFILNAVEENTADKVKEMIASFKTLYETDLSKKVDERLAKPSPKGGQSKTPLDITKMTADEINANWEQLSKM